MQSEGIGMSEEKSVLDGEACPYCPHSCPLTSPSCRRGQSYAAQLYTSRMELLEERRAAEERKMRTEA